MANREPRKVLKPDALYLGDNGRVFCGEHAGMTAQYTGRDLSGQRVMRVREESLLVGERFVCDHPGCLRSAQGSEWVYCRCNAEVKLDRGTGRLAWHTDPRTNLTCDAVGDKAVQS